jgi:hypothetical protein
MDARLRDNKKPGGMAALLIQTINHGDHNILAYASQKPQNIKKIHQFPIRDAIRGLEYGSFLQAIARLSVHLVCLSQTSGESQKSTH